MVSKESRKNQEVFTGEQTKLDLASTYGLDENEEYTIENAEELDLAKTKAKRRQLIFGLIFILLQGVASGFALIELISLNLLPTKFIVVISLVLVVLLVFTIISQTARNGRVVGRVYAIVLSIVFAVGGFYLFRTNHTLNQVTDAQITAKISDVHIIVLKDSPLSGLNDLAGKKLGVQTVIDRDNTEQTIKNLSEQLIEQPITVEYSSYLEAVKALYSQEADAIIINQAYAEALIYDTYPNFDTETRILESFTYTEMVEESSKPAEEESSKNVAETGEGVYNIYLSGNDSYGEITTVNGRSDVNILATVNTNTHTVILTTTPRDYYVQLSNGYMDKLTHASIMGINEPMWVLGDLYNVNVDYYVRVNFNGFEDIVNALGGVDVYSDYTFTAYNGYTYYQGYNYVYGESALAFVRERHAFGDGDMQRGRNQMAMIKAMITKILSPAILTNYLPLLDSLTGAFATNIPRELISDLVKQQLDNNVEWTIITQNVTGEGNMRSTYSGGSTPLYVMEPDYQSVSEAAERILRVMQGEKVEQPETNRTSVSYESSGSSGGSSSSGNTEPSESSQEASESSSVPVTESSVPESESSVESSVEPESSIEETPVESSEEAPVETPTEESTAEEATGSGEEE